jgi:hypothetical protein
MRRRDILAGLALWHLWIYGYGFVDITFIF